MILSSLTQEISELRERGRYRSLRRVSTPQDAVIVIDAPLLFEARKAHIIWMLNQSEDKETIVFPFRFWR